MIEPASFEAGFFDASLKAGAIEQTLLHILLMISRFPASYFALFRRYYFICTRLILEILIISLMMREEIAFAYVR